MSMKKSLVSALTTALVVGAASTTFAAANPFEDVAADHWAYDAIAQLAADGIVEGYGDGTFRGDQEITRYEMAQMVARAMAKNPSGADKALVDKLAAEFADELNNLGVRVSALEKKVDNVKWNGLFRYTYARTQTEGSPDDDDNTNDFRLRLSMEAAINEHWTGKGRVEYTTSMDNAANATGANDGIFLNRAWAEGIYGATMIQLGKFPAFTDVDNGMVYDDDLAGGLVKFGNKASVKLMVARVRSGGHDFKSKTNANGYDIGPASYQSIEINSDPNQKFTVGAAYHHFATKDLRNFTLIDGQDVAYNADQLNIWELGLGYRFDKNTKLFGAYARNASGDVDTKYRQAWNVEFDYKGADRNVPGSWGAWVAYRHLGNYTSICPTYNSMWVGQKGFNVGVKYTLFKNMVGMVEYFNGKYITTDRSQNTFFTRVELYF